MHDTHADSDASHSTRTDGATRRRFLKGTAAAGIAAAGIGTAASSASAQLFGGVDVINVDSSGWFGGWSADGSFPVTDELFVFAHGWFGDTTVTSQAGDVLDALDSGGYTPEESVAIEWPATTINFAGAESDTEDVGGVVADLAEEFYDAGGGNIRLTGHSLGGRIVYETITQLSSGYEIETAGALGAAADGSEICPGGAWNSGLDNACDVRNYHSSNDSIVGGAYGGLGGAALGTDGSGCNPGSNYTDVDVSWDTSSHLAHLSSGIMGDDLADAINSGSCDDGGSGSGGSTTSGSGGGWFGSDDGGSDDGGSFGWF